MTLNKALDLYYKSEYGDEKVYEYSIVKNGIVLIRKPKGIEYCIVHYLVTDEGDVIPTNPILSDINDVSKIIN